MALSLFVYAVCHVSSNFYYLNHGTVIFIMPIMKKTIILSVMVVVLLSISYSQEIQPMPSDPYFADFKPLKAPPAEGLYLKKSDRLAICGDSITEQKMYSRIMETYLTVCVPQLDITVRQFGWSGERAPGFLHRMKNDTLRFNPTIATTCYGMNDHRYQPYDARFGKEYEDSSRAIIRLFKDNGVRVIQGSAGTVGKMPHWVREAKGTVKDLNLSLLEFRNIDINLADQESVRFADVFIPMLVEGYDARKKYGLDYMISGKDGVHPGWAGHVVMAYAFLTAMGLDGDIGTITLDMSNGTADATEGHRVISSDKNQIYLESSRYPFCGVGQPDKDSSIRSGMALVNFNDKLNRLILKVRNCKPGSYKVTWGDNAKNYTSRQLTEGVNLADDFHVNPFSQAFKNVDDAVARKQEYETRQVKTLFHGPEGRADMEMTAGLTEKTRKPLADAIEAAFKPVRHTIVIKPE